MSQFHCKHCSRPMPVSFLEYRSNSYCNECFDERSASVVGKTTEFGTFEFMGESISVLLSDKNKQDNSNRLRKKS